MKTYTTIELVGILYNNYQFDSADDYLPRRLSDVIIKEKVTNIKDKTGQYANWSGNHLYSSSFSTINKFLNDILPY